MITPESLFPHKPILMHDLVARYKLVDGKWVSDGEASRHWMLDGKEVNEDGTPLRNTSE